MTLFAAGLVLALACHLMGSWDLLRYGGKWQSVPSDKLDYDIACYDLQPDEPELGRVVIYTGFGSSIQTYFPLALSLLRDGYAVRLVANSGSPNSKVTMAYTSHGIESSEATHPFLEARPDSRHFLIGHSEGTRYALQTAWETPSVDGVVLLSTVSAALDKERPSNVLILVAERDLGTVKRQTHIALTNGTRVKRPELNKTYGEIGQGTARRAQVMPETNHFSIILDKASHRTILRWINQISGNTNERLLVTNWTQLLVLAIGVLLGGSMAVAGIGLFFWRTVEESGSRGIPAWAMLLLFIAGWGMAAIFSNSIPSVQKIPLLAYGRILVLFAIAAVPLLLLVMIKPGFGIGIPRGPWGARMALLAATLMLFLFDRWLVSVLPAGRRLFWFGLAFLVSGIYFACDELLRRSVQRSTDWQTGLALGLAGSLISATSVAVASFFVWSPLGQFLVAGSVTLFVLLAACEIPATYLFTMTGDWLLSWWIRVSIFNGFLAGLVPLVSEAKFRQIIP